MPAKILIDPDEDEFIAKLGRKWTSSVPPVTRRRQCNIVRGSPEPTPATNAATIMSELFNMFFDDQIVDTICTFSNVEASRVVQDFSANPHSEQNENLDTCRSYFGVLLIAGTLRCRKETISEM